jgi:dihydroxyacetone kinase phosphoprotein-dependent L subunit
MTAAHTIAMAGAGGVVLDLVEVIHQNRQRLSEIDGAIGDGDHGINMDKGFSQCGAKLSAQSPLPGLPQAFETLALTLMDDIGGSMGPLYGSFFLAWSEALAPHTLLDAGLFDAAFTRAVAAVVEMGNAEVGDKTLMDTLVPARDAFSAARAAGQPFDAALKAMSFAAAQGMESTRALQARIGRAARLGARSIGVLDAGATSCCLILQSLAASLQRRLAGAAA